MLIKKIFDIQNTWGKVLFWIIIILSSIALVTLTALWGAAGFLQRDTTKPLINIGIYFFINLLINFLITKKNRIYLLIGVVLPIFITFIFWELQ